MFYIQLSKVFFQVIFVIEISNFDSVDEYIVISTFNSKWDRITAVRLNKGKKFAHKIVPRKSHQNNSMREDKLYFLPNYIQATLVTSTMHSSTLPLTSTQTPSPNIFPYMFIAFQQRIIRTTVSSSKRVIRHHFLVPIMNFCSFFDA